jgi:hypothetical protein
MAPIPLITIELVDNSKRQLAHTRMTRKRHSPPRIEELEIATFIGAGQGFFYGAKSDYSANIRAD